MMAYVAVLANRSIASLSQEDTCHCIIETGWLLTHSPSLRARRAIRPHPWMADFPMQALLDLPGERSVWLASGSKRKVVIQDHCRDNSGVVQDFLKRVLHRCHLFKSNALGGSSRPQLLIRRLCCRRDDSKLLVGSSAYWDSANSTQLTFRVELTSLKRSALTLRSPAIGSMRAPSGMTTPGTHHAHVTWAHTPFTVLGFRAPPAAHSSSRASQNSAGTAHRSDVHVSSKGSNPTARRMHPDAAAVTCHLMYHHPSFRCRCPLADKLSTDGRSSSWWQGCRLIAGALASILQQRLLHSQPVVAWSLLAQQRLALEAAKASKDVHQRMRPVKASHCS
eukprot:SM000085S23195  [mRNA]  locus=s85:27512:32909:+ [translate_table: standard]